jgi:hypothetical protein
MEMLLHRLSSQRRSALLILCFFFCAFKPSFGATSGSLQIELAPAAIQLAAGDSTKVIFILRNDNGFAIRDLHLGYYSDLGLQVTPESVDASSIGPHDTLIWPLTISQEHPGRSVGKLQLWVTYNTTIEGASVPGIVDASVDVQERPALDISKLVTLQLQAAVDKLDENQSAPMFVVLTNTAAVPVTAKRIETSGPKSISITSPDLGAGIEIPPQGSKTFPVTAKVIGPVLPGNQRVVISVDLTWTDAGNLRSGSLSVGQTLPLSIFGESDLLKAVGVPSFLFLPGFLLLATFYALWSRISPKTTLKTPLSVSETALIAVSLSLLAPLAYRLWTGRDYRQGYDVQDIMNVWFGSILLAFFAWAVVEGSRAMVLRFRDYKTRQEIARRTPTKIDSPMDMLLRMELNNSPAPPQQVLASLAGADVRAFFTVAYAVPDAETWVIPPIVLSCASKPVSAWSRDAVAARLDNDDLRTDYGQLREFLSNAAAAGWVAKWGESGDLVGPRAVKDIKPTDNKPGFEFIEFG